MFRVINSKSQGKVTSCQSHFWTQAEVALRSVRVPRPLASSFTYRNKAPRRPVSANTAGAHGFQTLHATSDAEKDSVGVLALGIQTSRAHKPTQRLLRTTDTQEACAIKYPNSPKAAP
jgi:hypothetical protein